MRRIIAEQYPFLWRSLRRLGVPDAQLEDAAQQVLVVMARRLNEIRVGAERTFVFSAAVRVAADARRSARRRREDPISDASAEVASPLPTPEDLASVQSDRRVLAVALESIPMAFRTVFILYEIEEMTAAEIAVMLSLPAGTVASRLRRARELFKEAIEQIRCESEARGASDRTTRAGVRESQTERALGGKLREKL
jgi:RNA polymerase sigma-70 factor (ECF subfamily)